MAMLALFTLAWSLLGLEGHLRRALGTPSLVLFGMVYMVPLTVFTTYGIVTEMTGGRVAVSYVITLVAMLFTARSYHMNGKKSAPATTARHHRCSSCASPSPRRR